MFGRRVTVSLLAVLRFTSINQAQTKASLRLKNTIFPNG